MDIGLLEFKKEVSRTEKELFQTRRDNRSLVSSQFQEEPGLKELGFSVRFQDKDQNSLSGFRASVARSQVAKVSSDKGLKEQVSRRE